MRFSTYPTFKAFRQSADFAAVGNDVAVYVREILKHGKCCDHPFGSAKILELLASVENGSLDFNDGLVAETCRINDWKLVTHDGDFTEGGIEVLTSNKRLLAACS